MTYLDALLGAAWAKTHFSLSPDRTIVKAIARNTLEALGVNIPLGRIMKMAGSTVYFQLNGIVFAVCAAACSPSHHCISQRIA